jgi:hypothetical protein
MKKTFNAWILQFPTPEEKIVEEPEPAPYTPYKMSELILRVVEKKYLADDKKEPSMYKMLEFHDIVRYGKPRTREYLSRYGFTPTELNWLEDEGMLEDKE